MKKLLTLTIVSMLAYTGYAQTGKVGVNETAPKATLDVKAQTVNTTADVEGILIPRVNKEKAYRMANATTKPQESNMVYVTDTISTAFASGTDAEKAPVADITEKGYYFWNGAKWVAVSGSNGQEWKDGTNAAGANLIYANQAKVAGKDVVVTDDGRLGIGISTPSSPFHARFVTTDGNVEHNNFTIENFQSDGDPSVILQYYARGLPSAPVNLVAEDQVGGIWFGGHVNGGYTTLGKFKGTYKGDGTTNRYEINLLNSTGNILLSDEGNVGIGSTSPLQKLHVNGNSFIQGQEIFSNNVGEKISFWGGTSASGRYGIGIQSGLLQFYTIGISGDMVFGYGHSTAFVENVRFKGNGNVGIGTGAPTQKLHVAGNVLANAHTTPDYVFQKYYDGESALKADYRMMSLSEVEDFTRKHKHLPGVPSAQEVEEAGGVLVNRATEINLEKIEELYLHTIEQEKKIDAQKERIEAQQQEIEALKAQNKKILKLESLVNKLLAEKK